jgi:hypothetical protein
MTGWKKAVLQAAVFGAAFAVVLCLIVGAWTWYLAHRSWNSTAIQATFKDLTLTTFPLHQSVKEDFSYVLENTTNADVRRGAPLQNHSSQRLAQRAPYSALKKEGSFEQRRPDRKKHCI